jgi:hypothetical protein
MFEVKISIRRSMAALSDVMGAVLQAHHHVDPVIFLREDWALRSSDDHDVTTKVAATDHLEPAPDTWPRVGLVAVPELSSDDANHSTLPDQ